MRTLGQVLVTNHRTLAVLPKNVRATRYLLSCDLGKENINMEVPVVLVCIPSIDHSMTLALSIC
ncbi:hypothetical protein PILCRDRAFT_467321 [Piloderma croceum F 1598]|uniref:Uncharacterized protein n=1 Tax=Piloderma croceum (strain F 1598) TaxID=765440 RepID=A0A0C3FUK7_PILCF|nr:hypothetical protein PILCRDRAFT_467321 [Piloderma croceum F 1598]